MMPRAQFIEETVLLVSRTLGASRLAFYEVDRRDNLHDFVRFAIPPDFHRHYLREMFAIDPLHMKRLAGRDVTVARLDDARAYAAPDDVRAYREFLRDFGVVDTIELVFRGAGRVRAGLNVSWTVRDAPPTAAQHALAEHLQRYIQLNFNAQLDSASDTRRERMCAHALTARECQVARLVCRGLTNEAIASSLGVRLSTIKTHLLHIFEKCRVETRAGLVARLSDADLHRTVDCARRP